MLRIGFLGCGEVAHERAAQIRALNESKEEAVFECVAACDLAPFKGAHFARRWGGESFSTPARMLTSARLDALFVAIPPLARGKAEATALSAGVALWIEPPLALTIRTANALTLAIKKSALPVMVAAPHRYCPELERLRRILTGKSAPPPGLWQGNTGAALGRTAWRSDPKNGGVWLDGAWPMLDLLRFLGIEAAKSSAQSDGERGAAVLGNRAGGFVSPGVSRFGARRESLEASGEGVLLSVKDWSGAPRVELGIKGESTIWTADDAVSGQLQAFARLLQSGKRTENRSPWSDALKTQNLALELGR